MTAVKKRVGAYLELGKLRIALFTALSSAAGFFAAAAEPKSDILWLITGVFMLACGSSALNQCQERDTDALMERTKSRPIPSGRIRHIHALYLSAGFISFGLLALSMKGGSYASLLGMSAVLWYNGVYTYLKRRTAFAAVPGALVGAIPPAIGWVFGGGMLSDPRLPALCFFFFMWQVPHFWILLLDHGKEYELAGLPSMSGIFSRRQLKRIIAHWIFATAVSCLFVALSGLVRSSLMTVLLLGTSAHFLLQGMKLMGMNEAGTGNIYPIFRRINYYMMSIIFLVFFDRMTYTWTEHSLRTFWK